MNISIKNYLTMAALTLAGAIMAGCSSSDDGIDTPPQPENTGKVVTLTTTVGFDDGSATTRALTANGVKTFAVGETMALVYENMSNSWAVKESEPLQADDIAEDGKSATFTFNLTEEPDKTKDVNYIYPAAMAMADGNENYEALCTEQDGTLTKLASNFDLATADHLAWADDGNLPGASLTNQFAILAITLKDDVTGDDITGSITGLTLTTRNNFHTESMTYNITRSAAAGPIYVAIHPTTIATIDVTATDGASTYIKTLEGKVYHAGNGYNVSWRMTNTTPLSNTTPLTMEVTSENGGTIVVNNPRSGMKYSVNGGAKTTMTGTTTIENLKKGDKVQFYGKGTSITTYYKYLEDEGGEDFTSIAGGTAEVKVYGNIMSLVNETGYADATTLTAENTFRYLFGDNSKLTDASGLLLPATTLTESCYTSMFAGCSSLTTAPALPATTLAYNCYNQMFAGCTSLTAAPALNAETLADYCYDNMFAGCTSLTAAPALPATTLAQGCYSSMFSGCSSLTAAPALPATTLKIECYYSMFSGCSSLTTAPALPATELAQGCYILMFWRCSSLTTAPVLPATTLAQYCYHLMFWECTKLSAVTCLATDISADGCTYGWLIDVAASGTFTTPSTTNWSTGTNGIPSGWTRVNYVAPSN